MRGEDRHFSETGGRPNKSCYVYPSLMDGSMGFYTHFPVVDVGLIAWTGVFGEFPIKGLTRGNLVGVCCVLLIG